jgi:hemolysin-activating ACP:hemolysin acyltransferase
MYENDVIFNKQAIPADIQSVIDLYKSFSKYGNNTEEELYYHVLPSFKLKQCKLFKENNKVIAFANWAFLNKETEAHFLKTKEMEDDIWNSGDIVWVHDVVAKEKGAQVAKWLRSKFKKFKWVRSDDNWNFYRIGKRGYSCQVQ